MRKFFVVFMTVLLSQSVFAQSGFDFGVKGGVNFNKVVTGTGSFGQNVKESYGTRTGFAAGVFTRFGKSFYLQPEILYVERNGNLTVGNTDYKIKYKSVDVPLLLGYRIANFVRLNVGPVANIKLSERNDFLKTLSSATEKDAFKTASFGYVAGVGVSLGNIDIDLRKDGSLGNVSSSFFQKEKYNQRLNGWQLTLGLSLF